MALTRASKVARTSSLANPITQAVTVTANDKVIVLLLVVIGPTVRGGGSPTFGGVSMTQAGTTQRAVTSPEASAEIWYVLNPLPGSYTLSIPNVDGLTIKYTVDSGQPAAGGRVAFDAAGGSNNTSTNPTCGDLTISESGGIVWSVVATGATTWSPSAQTGTIIANTDDGATGGGEQFSAPAAGTHTPGWTFGTSDDWGAVAAAFKEIRAHGFNNFTGGVRAGSGVSVGERVR